MKKAQKIYYGGDYNPDQWDAGTIDEDMRLFNKAGINLLTLPVFSWAKLEPDEGVYNFGWLDEIIDKIWEHGIYVCLATPTTAQPAWLSTRYPEVLPVDIAGRKRTHGMRVFFCVNSLKYRERAAAIAEEMAKRYAHHPALAMWHVSNEYGTYCYCPNCQAKFRLWLRRRYKTVEGLNEKWHTTFWGRIVTGFEEVTLPTELNDDYRFNPAIQLDYMRFVTDSTAECFRNEYQVLKKYNPEIPIQTNMSGYIKKLDQFNITKNLGKLKDMLGIWVEETDALRPWEKNSMKMEKSAYLSKEEYECGFLCDIIHPEGGAEVLARYGTDFYAGAPCVTVNHFGAGKAYYIGTWPEQSFLEELIDKICEDCGLKPPYASAEGVEITLRVSERARVVFVINHNKEEAWVDFGAEELLNLLNGEKMTARTAIAQGDVIVAKRLTEI